MQQLLWSVTFLVTFGVSQGANILFYFGLSTYSHRIAVWPLVEALAARGHVITFAQGFRPRSPSNVTGVTEFFPPEFERRLSAQLESFGDFNPIQLRIAKGRLGVQLMAASLPVFGLDRCEGFLSDPATLDLFQKTRFDLVVIDNLFNDCGLGMAAKSGAKVIHFGTSHPFPWVFEALGVVPDTAWIPDLHFSGQMPLGFPDRAWSTVVHLMTHYYRHWFYFPKLEAVLREKLDFPEMPPLAELERNVSLVLYNSHYSEELARSLPPLFIPVGGMHCERTDGGPLPKEIADFIESSGDEGFILVSFGGEAKFSAIPQELQLIFFEAFRRAGIRFLLKWEGERPKELPPNVKTVDWYPQNQVLASKRIRAFITHGGLLSMQEATTYGVPMIAFPLFAEQDYNAMRLERTRRGIRLEISTLKVEELQNAISAILTDPTYKLNTERAGKLFVDRPMKPVETAVWWTEYILRNEDNDHLKPLSINQYWFQRRLLDVWAFLGFSLLLIISLFIFISSKLLSYCFYSGKGKSGPSKRKKAKKL